MWSVLQPEQSIGTLAIETGTRRRIRINGTISTLTQEALELKVEQSFPNCPKYITQRDVRVPSAASLDLDETVLSGQKLTPDTMGTLARADALYIASANDAHGLDVSHRGGPSGFVEALSPTLLQMPDYSGNSMFQTLGNLALDPRAALAVPDFTSRRLLHLTGTAELLWDVPSSTRRTGGTNRVLQFHVDRWIDIPLPTALHAEFLEYSRFNPH